jgi:hypothetical protein
VVKGAGMSSTSQGPKLRERVADTVPLPRLHKRSQLRALHDAMIRHEMIPNLSLRSPFPSPRSTSTPSARVVSSHASCAPLTWIPQVKNASPHSPLQFFRGADAALLMFDVNQPMPSTDGGLNFVPAHHSQMKNSASW